MKVEDLPVGHKHPDHHIKAEGHCERCQDGLGHLHIQVENALYSLWHPERVMPTGEHEGGQRGQDHRVHHSQGGMNETALYLCTHGTGLLLEHELWLHYQRVHDAGGDGWKGHNGQVAGEAAIGAQA